LTPKRKARWLLNAVRDEQHLSAQSDVRDLCLVVLATVSVIVALKWAQAFFVPLTFGIVVAYALNPAVRGLARLRIPRSIGAAIVVLAVVSLLAIGGFALRDEVQTVLASVPRAAAKLSEGASRLTKAPDGALRGLQKAARTLDTAAAKTAGATNPQATHVVVDAPSVNIKEALWVGSKGALGVLGQLTMVLFLVYFLLASGDTLRRQLLRLAGPAPERRETAVRILDDVNSSIQRCMVILLATNVLVAIVSGAVFYLLGLENAGVWGAAAGVLHLIPYLGPAITAGATSMAAYMQAESFGTAALVASASLAIAVAIGVFATTWMTGRLARINAAAVFVSLLFWGWLWGAAGMILSVPIVVIVKVLCGHIDRLRPVAILLEE
jgi:predicted PurR-regulated permease PerM